MSFNFKLPSSRTKRRRVAADFAAASSLFGEEVRVGGLALNVDERNDNVDARDDGDGVEGIEREIYGSDSETEERDDDGDEIEREIDELMAILEEEENEEPVSFRQKLAEWAIRFGICLNALDDLLSIVREQACGCGTSLPKSGRTLLGTPRKVPVRQVAPGQYYHFGLLEGLKSVMAGVNPRNFPQIVHIFVNVDGLPISNSSGGQFWPILAMVANMGCRMVFLVGLYYGHEKPTNANDFLREFVNEAKALTLNGFEFEGQVYGFKVLAFICDTPARCFILFTKGHGGYNSCFFCFVRGENVGHVVFLDTNSPIRDDASFRNQEDEDHHGGRSILEEIVGLDMVMSFPNDPMHLFDLGWTRKFLYLWTKGPLSNRFAPVEIRRLNVHLECIKRYVPREFGRKTRSLRWLSSFKATEFHLWNSYVGPVVLEAADIHKRLKRVVNHFNTFHVVIRILSSKDYCYDFSDYASQLIVILIEEGIKIYGKGFASYNIHGALHIVLNVLKYGPLPSFSAYPFENFMQILKKLLRKDDRPLQQVVKRIFEIMKVLAGRNVQKRSVNSKSFGKEHTAGPIPHYLSNGAKQYETIELGPWYICPSSLADCCVYVKVDGKISVVDVCNIVACPRGQFIVGRKFTVLENLYSYPLESKKINEFKVSKLGRNIEYWPLSSIYCKAFKFPANPDKTDFFAAFPILMESHE